MKLYLNLVFGLLLIFDYYSIGVSAWSFSLGNHNNIDATHKTTRREWLAVSASSMAAATIFSPLRSVHAEDVVALPPVEVSLSGDSKKLFNEGRALEGQGNMIAAQRLYNKVTKISPRFVYGWSSLANTQVALGTLDEADNNYSKAIDLCKESNEATEEKFGVKRCSDLYLLLLNRGTVRLNNGRQEEALYDLQSASILRNRPDAILLQNLARAKEINGLYSQADKDYTVAISMTANEVNPFWLRSAMVKLQLGDVQGGFDLLRRVENRFPEAAEVQAAYATFLAAKGNFPEAQLRYLDIPYRSRVKYVNKEYLTKTITWPPAMIDTLTKITVAAGDGEPK